jgi:hypothetical protein
MTKCLSLNFMRRMFNIEHVIPAKAGIQLRVVWMPDRVRHDEFSFFCAWGRLFNVRLLKRENERSGHRVVDWPILNRIRHDET